jgi:glycosyltransferase involved in cell wall biosynthesis
MNDTVAATGQCPRLRVLVLSWRDEWHPEAGGSERTLGQVARGLVERGHQVTVATAAYEGRPRDEVDRGVRYRRRGGRLSVYPLGLLHSRATGYDVVVDVQNGIPFFAAVARPRTTLLVVHHIHREQWPVAVGPATAKVGWFLESRVSPLVHRASHAVAVSTSTAKEMVGLGHPEDRLLIVRNGSDIPESLPPRDDQPRVVVVSRLVPHKQVEHAIEAVARVRRQHPDVRLRIVGEGYHRPELEHLAARLGIADRVDFLGFVTDEERDAELARAWVHMLPSLKEGWGLVAVEAAACGTPTLAYRSAGGVNESVLHGVTGYLCDDQSDLEARLDALLSDRSLVERMGMDCGIHAAAHSWKAAVDGFEDALMAVRASGGAGRRASATSARSAR